MRRSLAVALVLALPVPVAAVALPELLPASPPALEAGAIDGGELRAGAAVVDATWHVGASQGQYAGEGPGMYDQAEGTVDPSVHATTSNPTHGIESRATVRALVLDDGDDRWALLTNDLYIPQELLNRRVATLLAEHDALHPEAATGITADNLTITVSHSHSSPFYSSTAWGAWAFQDAFDLRFFEFMARRMADSVIQASAKLQPARAGVATRQVAIGKRNPEGPTVSQEDEPLPAGWPMGEMDATLSLLRVDTPAGEPIAHWVVWGRHPEGMEDNGLHSAEYVGALQRTIDREIGGVSLFSQNDVGTSEITRQARVHPSEARQEYDDNSHNMLERFARALADEVHASSADIARRWRDPAAETVHGSDQVVLVPPGAPLEVKTMRFAPPSYRVFPSVSNCRTERTADGDPGIPLIGLPDCTYFMPGEVRENSPVDPGVTYDTLRQAGVPVPDNYGVPSYTGLQESLLVPVQAIRLGGVAFTACPCEQFTDMSRNIRARLDKTPGNLWFGWDWTANHRFHPDWEPGVAYVGDLLPDGVLGEGVRRGPAQLDLDPAMPGEQFWCTPDDAAAPSTWTCKDPRAMGNRESALPAWSAWPTLPPVSHAAFVRWKARIYNDAAGWDGYVSQEGGPDALTAEAEPADVTKVWGNWIHEELTPHGYDVVVPLSMANDYWGYIPPYREFQARDYYRKALAGLGPHSADFLTTRLTRMAAELNGAPDTLVEYSPKDLAYQPEAAHTTAKAVAIGGAAEVAMRAYEAALSPDGGAAGTVLAQPPASLQRFGAATMQWVGGSNYTDVPHARVERLDPHTGQWTPFGDGYGEVQVKLAMPKPEELPLVAAGQFTWKWTAVFETYDSDIDRTWADGAQRGQVPDGTYRFVVDGCHRGAAPDGSPEASCSEWDLAGRVRAYRVESQPFQVAPWTGLTVEDFRVDGEAASFTVGPKPPMPLSASNSTMTSFRSGAGVLRHELRDYTIGRFDYTGADPVDYPDTLPDHPLRYVSGRSGADNKDYGGNREVFCFACTLEPWAETGAVARAAVTVLHANGKTDVVPATFDPATGRWTAPVALRPGDQAFVAPGGVVDVFGETNGAASATVSRAKGGKR